MGGFAGGGFHGSGMARGGFRSGGFAGLDHGGFHDRDGGGFHDHGFRGHDRDFDHRFIGYGFYDNYPYDDSYPYDYSYADGGDSYYDNGGCYLVRRRVHTTHGWHTRLAQVCG